MPKTINIDLGYRPHKYQKIAQAIIIAHRFTVLVCHRRFGKTFLAVFALIHAALSHKQIDNKRGRYAYIAPFRNQAKEIAWMYLIDAVFGSKRESDDDQQGRTGIPGAKKHESDLWIEFPNGARITIYGADNADSIRGKYFHGLVADELADWKPDVWEQVIRPTLADTLGWAIFIGTPKGINVFYELWQKALENPKWGAAMFRSDETELEHLKQSEIDDMREEMSTNAFRQEMLCDFSAAADDVLITIDLVSEACARYEVKEENLHGLPKVIGVDVARFGDDRSVIIKRWGHLTYPPKVFDDVDNMWLAGQVAKEIDEFQPDVTFVDGGRGEGVIDRLRQLGHQDVIEVAFGGTPNDEHYKDKRSEMWGLGKKHLVEGGMLPNHPELKTDLCVPTYGFTASKGQEKLESKDHIKERGMKSPDIADAWMCTFAETVIPKSHRHDEDLSEWQGKPAVANNGKEWEPEWLRD